MVASVFSETHQNVGCHIVKSGQVINPTCAHSAV